MEETPKGIFSRNYLTNQNGMLGNRIETSYMPTKAAKVGQSMSNILNPDIFQQGVQWPKLNPHESLHPATPPVTHIFE